MKKTRLDPVLYQLCKQLVELKKEAKRLGVFTGDRELLTCPQCGLMEDVSGDGTLLTYWPKSPEIDTNLRFKALDRKEERFRCPSCGAVCTAPEPADIPDEADVNLEAKATPGAQAPGKKRRKRSGSARRAGKRSNSRKARNS